jgi:alkylation response protein AidB-like acyl-CoA dehydrogenase
MSSVSALVEEARDFIRDNWSKDIDLAEWREKVVDAKWAALRWPVDAYGRGLNDEEAEAVEAVFSEAGISGPGQDKFNLWAGTLVGFGTDELKQQYVRRLLLDEVAMCLLYSEPGAGSDLAGIRTTAVRDGDEWVINGQKVWTSGAKGADIGMLIARTDWDQPKHRGISFFYFPMKQPGVEVRPLRQATGDSRFNEVFITDARVPHANLLGDLNKGWWVLQSALAYERAAMGISRRGPRGPGGATSAAHGSISKSRLVACESRTTGG